MNKLHRGGTVLLLLAVLASALSVVYAKHRSRVLFVQLQGLQEQRDQLHESWGRLQLEQATWATHSRVESVARGRLGMRLPSPASVTMVR